MRLILMFVSTLVIGAISFPCPAAIPQHEIVELCELQKRPAEYAGKKVELQTTLATSEEFRVLRDAACPPLLNPDSGKHDVIEAVFDNGRYDIDSSAKKKLEKLLKRDHQAEVHIVGIFVDPGKYFGHQMCCRYQVKIQQLLSVEKVPSSRLKTTIRQKRELSGVR